MEKRTRVSHTEGVLSQRTRELLRTTTIPYLEIFKATDISPNWLSLFVNGRIPDPGVNRVECLYNFLSDKTLESQLKTSEYHSSMCHLIVAGERAAASKQ